MVREASRRQEKYAGKVDADVARSRILALKASMVEQMNSAAADLATLEAETKRVIEGQTTPIYGHQIPAYLNVARELFRLSRKFGSTTFTGEGTLVCNKWSSKGLDAWAIAEIASLFGLAWSAP